MRSRRGRPDQIGRYEVRGNLGGGGMGDVYRVFDPVTGRELALKVLKFTYPRALHYFKREFRAVAALSHPNLVGLYDLHYADGQYFYTMEIVEGTDLYIHVNGHNRVVTHAPTLTRVDRVARLRADFVQLLRGLAYLHAHGRIHRDIKPSNVLVDKSGVLKLVDFGIVKELLPGGLGQSLSQVFGTSTYFSPEQSLGSQVTAATDLYAAGVVLYELLAGTPPFEGESAEVAVMHREQPPPSLVQRVPGVPPDLALVCMELLKKAPTDRPSAVEALEMLKAEVEPVVAATEFVGRRPARKVLHQALSDVRGGQGRLVVVEGPAGIGKTALIEEFGREARLYGAALFTGDCVVRDHVPLRGLDTVVERIAEAYRRQTARVLRRQPRAMRAPLIAGLTFLGELLPAREHGEPDGTHSLAESLSGLLTSLAGKRLLVLALEQVHLADESVCEVIEALQGGGQPPPVLLIVTVQPDGVAPDGRVAQLLDFVADLPSTRRVTLAPFTLAETRQLLEDQLDAAPSWLADHIHAQTRGVPLFVAEMVDALRRDPDAAPPTLADSVARRLATLDEHGQALVELLAVSRRPPSAGVLRAATGLDVEGVHQAMRRLSTSGLAHVESTPDGAVMLVPRHRLLMDLVRQGLDPEARQARHAELARAHQSAGDAREVEHHWTAAGQPGQAVHFASRTASRARHTDEAPRAVALLEMALHGETDADRRAQLLLDLSDSRARAGRFAEAAEALSRLADEHPAEGRRWRPRRAQLLLLAGDVSGFDALADGLPEAARPPLAALLAGIDPLRAEATLGEASGPRADVIRARLLAGRPGLADVEDAEALLDLHRDEGRHSDAARRAAYALARVAVFEARGWLGEAQEVVEEAGVLLLHRMPTHDPVRAELMLARARLDLERGQLKAARMALRPLNNGSGARSGALRLLQARLHLEAGEIRAADRVVAELEATPAPGDDRVSLGLGLLRARRRLYQGEADTALIDLRAVAAHRLSGRRGPMAEQAILRARARLTRALQGLARGRVAPDPLADSRLELERLEPPPRTWPELVAAFEALVADDLPTAAMRIDRLTRSDARPDHPIVLALVRALLAAIRGRQGRDPRQERKRAERLVADVGAITPPEMTALKGLV